MKWFSRLLILTILITPVFKAHSGGIPVVDTKRALDKALDMVASMAVFSELIEQFSDEVDFVNEVRELREVVSETERLLQPVEEFGYDYKYVKDFNMDRYQAITGRVRAITGLVKRVKKMASLVMSASSSESLTAMVNTLRNEREQADAVFQTKMTIAKVKYEARKQREMLKLNFESRRNATADLRKVEKEKNKFRIGDF